MESTGFDLMPSPHPPDDFREAKRTVRVELPSEFYNPPIRVAEEFAIVDVITGGRLTAGSPGGTPMDTHFCYVPDRRVSMRLCRQTTPTPIVWGTRDEFIPPLYAERWSEPLPDARGMLIDDAGNMARCEEPDAVRRAVADFPER